MVGRDPHERHRVATPLELLFDLTFVIAFGVAGSEFAHLLAAGHVWAGLTAFLFATFATVLAWINFTWFASAYDTDDWIYRVLTMVGHSRQRRTLGSEGGGGPQWWHAVASTPHRGALRSADDHRAG
jgi:hypothetical protein